MLKGDVGGGGGNLPGSGELLRAPPSPNPRHPLPAVGHLSSDGRLGSRLTHFQILGRKNQTGSPGTAVHLLGGQSSSGYAVMMHRHGVRASASVARHHENGGPGKYLKSAHEETFLVVLLC